MQQTSTIRVDQILHGYAQGHREVCATAALDDPSRSTMVVMSDLLTDRTLLPGESYLTCYPLRSAAKHVLARTWSAGPKFRPGSVWTHSLILDYKALAVIADLSLLLRLFCDPSRHSMERYQIPLSMTLEQYDNSSIDVETGARSMSALEQLYGPVTKSEVVLPDADAEANERLAVALWRQMWPSLRREFSFVTVPYSLPIAYGTSCHLRFSDEREGNAPHDRNGRVTAGYEELLSDLSEPGPTALRTFLGRYVIEASDPRQFTVPLVRLATLVSGASLDSSMLAIHALTNKQSLPRLVRDFVTTALNSSPDDQSLIDIVRQFKDDASEVDFSRTVERAKGMPKERLLELANIADDCIETGLGRRLFNEVALGAPVDVLAYATTDTNRLRVLELRPELFDSDAWWPREDAKRADLLKRTELGASASVAWGIRTFGRELGARTLTVLLQGGAAVCPIDVADLLVNRASDVAIVAALWLLHEPNRFREFAMCAVGLPLEALDALARAQISIGVDSIDAEAWSNLLLGTATKDSQFSSSACAVGYFCALKLTDERSIELAALTFSILVDAVEAKVLPTHDVHMLERALWSVTHSWILRSAVPRSAVLKWKPSKSTAGVFVITDRPEQLRVLADHVASTEGRRVLEDVVRYSPLGLSSVAQREVAKYLRDRAERKAGPFGLW